MKNNDTIVLCPACIPMSCCPTLSKAQKNFIIEDDYGSSISLTKKEAEELVLKIDEFLSLPRSSLDS